MNRDLWFRILQVVVVAPFIYSMSEQQKNAYFKLGLKLVAGSIIIMNVPPIYEKAQPLIAAAIKYKADADAAATIAKENAIEGEFTETPPV